MEPPSQEGPTRVRDEDEEREIKQTKQIANKVRPAQRPAWPCRQAWLCVVPAQGVFIRRTGGGTGGREFLLRASSWQCKDNELVAFNVAANEARQRSSQMSVKRRRRRNRREKGWGAKQSQGEGGGSTSVTRRKRMMDEFVICRLNKYVPRTLN